MLRLQVKLEPSDLSTSGKVSGYFADVTQGETFQQYLFHISLGSHRANSSKAITRPIVTIPMMK